jgi:NAD-dependent deacetylase
MQGSVIRHDRLEQGDPAAREAWAKLVSATRSAAKPAALTGAGISVESGVPDFRSENGVWARFPVEEYGTIDAFTSDPDKAWRLYRAIWSDLGGKRPNAGHEALAELERAGRLAGIVTQNIDGLHQAAGSRNVIEMHGDVRDLQCIECGWTGPADVDALVADTSSPRCPECGRPVKPNAVFFGELVRGLPEIDALLEGCDLMLVVGTSALVFPASQLPEWAASRGGRIAEFNLSATALDADFSVLGPAGRTLPHLARDVLADGADRP